MEWPQIIENKTQKPIEPANSSISDMYYISSYSFSNPYRQTIKDNWEIWRILLF